MLTLLTEVMAICLQKNRRKIIWFTQPNNMVVKTNVGKMFFMSGEKKKTSTKQNFQQEYN